MEVSLDGFVDSYLISTSMPFAIQLPSNDEIKGFNQQRWVEILSDPQLANLDFRIETDRYGHLIMSPSSRSHSRKQSEFAYLLRKHLKQGITLTECPISTRDGVKAADAAWVSTARDAEIKGELYTEAPEICVEVMSPSNTQLEMEEKKALYFESGAEEVWICNLSGNIQFFLKNTPQVVSTSSSIAPDFPQAIDA